MQSETSLDTILHRAEQQENREKELIRSYFNNKRNGICIEVGSHDPTSFWSQSWHLEEKLDWKCILVEPNPVLAEKTRQHRPRAAIYECACVGSGRAAVMELHIPLTGQGEEVTGHAGLEKNVDEHNYNTHKSIAVQTMTLNRILTEETIDSIDFLSIDVEGTEFDVLQGIDLGRYRPNLILLEDKNLYLNTHLYLKKQGYKLVKRFNRNGWYIPSDVLSPAISAVERFKLFKRLYISIWFNKLVYALRHKSLQPFSTL